jgi:hypothetical protein
MKMRKQIEYKRVPRKFIAAEGTLIIIFQHVGQIGIFSLVVMPLDTNKIVRAVSTLWQPTLKHSCLSILAAFCIH